jgi:hypothetical protein
VGRDVRRVHPQSTRQLGKSIATERRTKALRNVSFVPQLEDERGFDPLLPMRRLNPSF